jgi:hypothetical protein
MRNIFEVLIVKSEIFPDLGWENFIDSSEASFFARNVTVGTTFGCKSRGAL